MGFASTYGRGISDRSVILHLQEVKLWHCYDTWQERLTSHARVLHIVTMQLQETSGVLQHVYAASTAFSLPADAAAAAKPFPLFRRLCFGPSD